MAAHPSAQGMGDFGAMDNFPVRQPGTQDLDVTVLAFAQWLSEMRSRSNASLQQMLAEMGIIRNGITSNNTDLTEFKRNTAQVQQQMQSQISDLVSKLTDAYTEIANMKKAKNQFEQETHTEYHSLSEQLQLKNIEFEKMKKAYAQTHQALQGQVVQLQQEVSELRMRGDEAHRTSHLNNEQSAHKVGELDLATQMMSTDNKRLRAEHDQAIGNLAENMNRWNEALRDLSKEFHDFQKVMNVHQQRMNNSVWEMQARVGLIPSREVGGSPQQQQPQSQATSQSQLLSQQAQLASQQAQMAAQQGLRPPSGVGPSMVSVPTQPMSR